MIIGKQGLLERAAATRPVNLSLRYVTSIM